MRYEETLMVLAFLPCWNPSWLNTCGKSTCARCSEASLGILLQQSNFSPVSPLLSRTFLALYITLSSSRTH
ncbi:hypothetical protein LZ31DRAFT_163638 [Colletotrichum somersetense]|nr:hypothetical protein LZ31DRAFT_163638 [Colletotrichum somersetense]